MVRKGSVVIEKSIHMTFENVISYLEIVGVGLAILYLLMAIFHLRSCWYAAIFSSAVYIPVFDSAKLYMDAGLQVFFIAGGAYGLWQWKKVALENHNKTAVRSWARRNHVILIASGVVIALLIGRVLQSYTDAAYPMLDSMITVFSIANTFLNAWKLIESWIYWVVIDLVAAGVFAAKGLTATSGLYVLFAALAFFALIKWRRDRGSHDPKKSG